MMHKFTLITLVSSILFTDGLNAMIQTQKSSAVNILIFVTYDASQLYQDMTSTPNSDNNIEAIIRSAAARSGTKVNITVKQESELESQRSNSWQIDTKDIDLLLIITFASASRITVPDQLASTIQFNQNNKAFIILRLGEQSQAITTTNIKNNPADKNHTFQIAMKSSSLISPNHALLDYNKFIEWLNERLASLKTTYKASQHQQPPQHQPQPLEDDPYAGLSKAELVALQEHFRTELKSFQSELKIIQQNIKDTTTALEKIDAKIARLY